MTMKPSATGFVLGLSLVCLAAWGQGAVPALPPVQATVFTAPRVTVKATRIDGAYGVALATILSEALKEYDITLGMAMPESVELDVERNPNFSTELWTDGQSQIYLHLHSMDDLAPPTRSRYFNIYGMCQELGLISLDSRMANQVGLPDGVAQGWAHYAGSVVVDAVAKRLGKNIWPEPYDVETVDGIPRLERQIAGDPAKLDPRMRAAKAFYDADLKYGRGTVGKAMAQALATKPEGGELMPRFVAALKGLSGDPKAGDFFPPEMITATVKWDIRETRPVGEDFFAGLKATPDATGTVLSYVGDTNQAMLSMAGAGQAVLFRAPAGNWAVDRVSIFGGRYGSEDAPAENFWVYVCDENFSPLGAFAKPYSIFAERRGEQLKWYDIPLGPQKVPQRFFICVYFNATAYKGVYVGEDTTVASVHSFTALPYSFVDDVSKKCDWMIRVHLSPVVGVCGWLPGGAASSGDRGAIAGRPAPAYCQPAP
jgi:hypothetical protein